MSGAPAMIEPHDESTLRAAVARKGSFGQTMKAVAFPFFGIRQGAWSEKGPQQQDGGHVIIAGIVGAALFVAALVLLVHWVTGSGVAGGS